jgi:phosphoinositide-3-kinase regulatory subunit 4
VDKKRHWLVVGTSHGVLDLWDLRFKMRIKAYSIAGGAPIYRLTIIPTPRAKSRSLRFAIAGGTGQPEITVWDIEKTSCTNVFRTGTSGKDPSSATYKLSEVDEDKSSGGMLSRFATVSKTDPGITSSGPGSSIRALATNLLSTDSSSPDQPFFLTAGPDWKVRFWVAAKTDLSTVVSGVELEEGKPTYTISQPSPDLQIMTERLNPRGEGAREDGGSGNATPRKKGKGSVISMHAQVLLKTHLDVIIDVAFLEVPYGMVVSADRAGVVYVFS